MRRRHEVARIETLLDRYWGHDGPCNPSQHSKLYTEPAVLLCTAVARRLLALNSYDWVALFR